MGTLFEGRDKTFELEFFLTNTIVNGYYKME